MTTNSDDTNRTRVAENNTSKDVLMLILQVTDQLLYLSNIGLTIFNRTLSEIINNLYDKVLTLW